MNLRALICVCLVLWPSTAVAQGTIAGVARDSNGSVLPGVTVELATAADPVKPRSTVTDAAGRYEFGGVPLGDHSVTFRLPGFATQRRDAAVTATGATVTVDGLLLVGPLQDATQFQRPLPPSSVPPRDVPPDRCLHGDNETPAEYQRRSDAFGAMHMIDRAVRMASSPWRAPSWGELATSGVVAALRGMQGPAGELARRFAWGESQPLPGWSVAYIRLQNAPGRTAPPGVRFALRDERDPCGFTYTSEDPQVLPQGFKILPLYED